MKTLDKIPTTKIQRASKLLSTGAKVGVNYLKYYGDQLTKTREEAKTQLDKNNAEDIYDSLKELKGSALKVAQMLSMEKNILPEAYVEKFSLSQFSVPPLSAPLVQKTFRKYFGKNPSAIFDHFDLESVNAASIGQVHKAELQGKKLAVKIQYPGVSETISTDLAMVKPIAIKMFNIRGKDSDQYFKEVENKLLEETDYILELKQSQEVAENCKNIPNLKFPEYYPEFSTDRIITMDWMEGIPLSEFSKSAASEEERQKVGQTFWDFYMYQLHVLKKVHADPHPGNFLISKDSELIAIDFGCMKKIPQEFYLPYFELADRKNLNNPEIFTEKLFALEILREDDTEEEKIFFSEIFKELLFHFTQPLQEASFDFSNEKFFQDIAALGQKYASNTQLRKMNGNRGSKHFIYINRTFFGLYSLMHEIGAKNIEINSYKRYISTEFQLN